MKFKILIPAISIIFTSFAMNVASNIEIINTSNNSDSLVLEKYKNQIKKEYIENVDSFTTEQVDSVFSLDRRVFRKCNVVYSHDQSFKIFTIEVESCGAYCNSSWFSWIHYDLKNVEKIKKMDFGVIDSIYKLPDSKYLIVSMNWGRPTSAYYVHCINADLISFTDKEILTHSISYKGEKYFGFCQESTVQLNKEPFIKYEPSTKKLSYHYGNNNSHDNNRDVDIIKKGYFLYKTGKFIFVKETTSVIKR